ncbi:MAG TPA: hypothetical protein DEA08_24345 [Planctomycetes bacterium]|nr:hypothetical protein [Planctomycetota bacterium]
MDEEVHALIRAANASPEDAELAERLERALLRAGEQEALAQRYEVVFRCDVSESQLTPQGQHHLCSRCQERVYRVHSQVELEKRVRLGQCVEVEPEELPAVLDHLIESERRALRAERVCVVPRWSRQPKTLRRGRALPRVELPLPQEPSLEEARAQAAELRAQGAAEHVLLVLDVPGEGGGWVARVEGALDLAGTQELEFVGSDEHTSGVVRDGIVRLRVRPGKRPPKWQRGSIVLANERVMLRGRVSISD